VTTTAPQTARIASTGQELASAVKTASSVWARFMGLMGRSELAAGEALWFPGDASIHMLFMRFPIDAVFLAPEHRGAPAEASNPSPVAAAGSQLRRTNGAWRVVAIRARLRPWIGVVWYVRGARGCLELAAGAAERAGLQVGDIVEFVGG
jgi:uncharacterized protein